MGFFIFLIEYLKHIILPIIHPKEISYKCAHYRIDEINHVVPNPL